MLRIDSAYLYEVGAALRQLVRLPNEDSKRIDIYFICLDAKDALRGLLYESIFGAGLRTSRVAAPSLLQDLNEIAPPFNPEVNWEEIVPLWRLNAVRDRFSKFEAVLTAELQGTAIYYASPKGGFETGALTEAGEVTFPPSLGQVVPEALADIRSATRCIAFDLPTAAAFHLHRANEAVLRAYFDAVVGAEKRPNSNNMGDLLNNLSNAKEGNQKVTSVLKAIKDLHRNPIMHPDQSLSSIDEALSLMSAVRAAIGYMLHDFPMTDAPVIAELPLNLEASEKPISSAAS